MTEEILVLLLASIPLMVSPGPAWLSLAGAGSAFGFRASMPYLTGIILGTVSVLLIVASGVSSILSLGPIWTQILTVCAAAYILFLAWKIATAPVASGETSSGSPPRFIPGLLLSIANPKAYAAIGAIYSSHIIYQSAPMKDALAKVLVLGLLVVAVASFWLTFGTVFSRAISHPRLGRIVNVVFAGMLVSSVLIVLLSG